MSFELFIFSCLFQRKIRATVIARSSSLSFCKNFDVADNSKNIKHMNTKLGILSQHDKMLVA